MGSRIIESLSWLRLGNRGSGSGKVRVSIWGDWESVVGDDFCGGDGSFDEFCSAAQGLRVSSGISHSIGLVIARGKRRKGNKFGNCKSEVTENQGKALI